MAVGGDGPAATRLQRLTEDASAGAPLDWWLSAYESLSWARAVDRKLLSLSRQGRIGTYTPLFGQEATQVGAALALRPDDWLVPTFRDSAALLTHGVPLAELLLFWMGFEEGNRWSSRALPIAAPVASQLPHAVGLAWAAALDGTDRATLALLGDGATSKGDFHEALNLAAVLRAPVVFLCENNQWALSTPLLRQTAEPVIARRGVGYGVPALRVDGNDVGAMYRYVRAALKLARTGGGPVLIEALTYRRCGHSAMDSQRSTAGAGQTEYWARRDPVEVARKRLETSGNWSVEWEQRIQTQIAAAVSEAVGKAETRREELLSNVQVLFDTAYAELPPELQRQRRKATARMTGTAASVPTSCDEAQPGTAAAAELPAISGPSRDLTMVGALNCALAEELDRDERVRVLGEDVGTLGGVFRVTAGLVERFGGRRVVDMPLSESAIAGAAIGLALAGRRPVLEIQFSGFLYPAFDQLANHAARFRSRSSGQLAVPLVCRSPVGGGVGAPESHSDSPEAIFAHVPGLKVVVPSSPRLARALLKAAIRDPDPVIFLEPIALYRAGREPVPLQQELWPIGRARRVRCGSDITIVTYGAMLRRCLEAAAVLQQEDAVEADVLDLVTISPLDLEPIAHSVAQTKRVLVVHEAPRTGGIGGEILAGLQERGLGSAAMARVTGWDIPYPFPARERCYVPAAADVVHAARAVLGASSPGARAPETADAG